MLWKGKVKCIIKIKMYIQEISTKGKDMVKVNKNSLMREGKGIMYWNNGGRYEGEYKNGNREGKGIMYYNDGDRYEGDFKNGVKFSIVLVYI